MGKDLLYLVPSSGNVLRAKWLHSALGGDDRVHTTANFYCSSHIDSTAMCLRPELVLLNATRFDEKHCPAQFRAWGRISPADVAPTSDAELKFQKEVCARRGYALESPGGQTTLRDMASPWVGMNFLSRDPETARADELQTDLAKLQGSRNFMVISDRMRHIWTQGGGSPLRRWI